MVTKVTLVVGDGAWTENAMVVLSVAGVAVVDATGDVIWKAVEAPVTVKAIVRVSPTPATVMVTVPPVVGVTVAVNVPEESVTPVPALSETIPLVEGVNVMV